MMPAAVIARLIVVARHKPNSARRATSVSPISCIISVQYTAIERFYSKQACKLVDPRCR